MHPARAYRPPLTPPTPSQPRFAEPNQLRLERRTRGADPGGGPLREPVRALLEELLRRLDERADRVERERATDRYPLDPDLLELRHRWRPRPREHVHREADRLDDASDVLGARQARRVEDVGAGALVRLQAGDRVRQVLPAVDVVLRSRRDDEVDGAAVGDFDGRGDALRREVQLVDRVVLVTGEVLDRASRQTRLDGQADRLRHPTGIVRERVFEVRRHGQVRRLDDRRRVREGLIARH